MLLGKAMNQEQGHVKDKMGNLVTGERKVLQRQAEHFDELLNGHGDEERSKGDGRSEHENMDEYLGKEEENGTDKSLETTDVPTKEEVKAVVDKLKKQQGARPRWNTH